MNTTRCSGLVVFLGRTTAVGGLPMPVTPVSPTATSRIGTWWTGWTSPHAHPCFARVTGLWADPVTVLVHFDEGHGSAAPAPAGRLTAPHSLPVGRPTRLVLDDGLQGLVIIDDRGRFVAGRRFR